MPCAWSLLSRQGVGIGEVSDRMSGSLEGMHGLADRPGVESHDFHGSLFLSKSVLSLLVTVRCWLLVP